MALIKDKILVIEDEKSISYLLGTVLTANGYDVIKAYTGTEACEMLDAIVRTDPAGSGTAGYGRSGHHKKDPYLVQYAHHRHQRQE